MPEGVLTPRLVVALGVTRWNQHRMPMRGLRNRYLALDDGLQQFCSGDTGEVVVAYSHVERLDMNDRRSVECLREPT